MPHLGGWRDAGTPRMAYRLNVPVLTASGMGARDALAGFASVDRENVIVEVVKQQLDGEDTILRLYECYGARTDVTLTLGCAPKAVMRVNLLEDETGEIDATGSRVRLTMKPYEILSLKVRFA